MLENNHNLSIYQKTQKYPNIPENTRNTQNTRKYPRVKEIPGNTRSHISTLLPDPNPTRYPVFCPIPNPILKNPTRLALLPLWIWICWGRQFKGKKTQTNSCWWKILQMQPVWICDIPERSAEEIFENSIWRKTIQIQPMWVFLCLALWFEQTFEKSSNCSQCGYVTKRKIPWEYIVFKSYQFDNSP